MRSLRQVIDELNFTGDVEPEMDPARALPGASAALTGTTTYSRRRRGFPWPLHNPEPIIAGQAT